MESTNKNNVKPIILTIIGVLIVLLIIIGVVYKINVVGNPVRLTTAALKSLGNGFDKSSNIGKTMKFMDESDAVAVNINGNVTLPMNYGKVSIDMLLEEDVDDAEAIMNLDIKQNGTDAFYLEGQLDKSALYFAFQKNASKYYFLSDVKYPEALDEIDFEDFLDIFIESFEEIVTKEHFKESEQAININNGILTTKKYSLAIDMKLVSEITNKVIDKILYDEDLIENLSEFLKMSEREVIENLNNNKVTKDDFQNMNDSTIYTYNIYVYKNTAIRYELVIEEENGVMYVDNYEMPEIVVKGLDEYGDESSLTIKKDNNEWNINYFATDFKMVGTITEEYYDLSITVEGMEIIINGNQKFNQNMSGITYTEVGKISMNQDGATIEIPYDFNINLKEINRVNKKNTSNRVDISNMTEIEEAEFINELMQIPIFNSLMTTNTQTNNYNVDYDYPVNNTEFDYSGTGFGY